MNSPAPETSTLQTKKSSRLFFQLMALTVLLGLTLAYVIPTICIATRLISSTTTVQVAPINVFLSAVSFLAIRPILWRLRVVAQKIGNLKQGGTEGYRLNT